MASGRCLRTSAHDGMILLTFCLIALILSSCNCAITSATPKKPIMAAM
ncbi:hypothetical protein Y695_03150 [Hydrogenophaga sp. T4]|nr:hypothetical protein Y695_03150 [Hydrogenophaga sp. T4]